MTTLSQLSITNYLLIITYGAAAHCQLIIYNPSVIGNGQMVKSTPAGSARC